MVIVTMVTNFDDSPTQFQGVRGHACFFWLLHKISEVGLLEQNKAHTLKLSRAIVKIGDHRNNHHRVSLYTQWDCLMTKLKKST